MNQCESQVRAIKKMCLQEISSLSGYQPIEYIWMPGGSYIDTGVSLTGGAIGEMRFNILSGNLGNGGGAKDGTTSKYNRNYFNFWYDSGSSKYIIGMGAGGYNSKHPTYTHNTLYTVSYNTPNHTAVINGTNYNFNNYGWMDSQSPPYSRWTWVLHGSTDDSTGAHSGQTGELIVYYYKLSDHNGVFKRDLQPMIRKADNVVGMYDLVSGTFFTNAGAGQFIAPIIRNLPEDYQEVGCLYSNGSGQYIDTQLIPTTTYRWELDIRYGTLPSNWSFQNGVSQKLTGDRFMLGAYENKAIFGMGDQFSASCTYTDRHTYFIDLQNNTYGIDDNSYSHQSTYTKSANYTIKLFWRDSAGSLQSTQKVIGWIYSSKIYNSGTLIQDLIPCYRKSDNKPGMYDLVTDTFFTNAGSGEFTLRSGI